MLFHFILFAIVLFSSRSSGSDSLEYPELADSIRLAQKSHLNPCDDFHKFVCTGFNEMATGKLSDQQNTINHDTLIEEEHLESVERKFNELLLSPDKRKNNSKCAEKMLIFYDKCRREQEWDLEDSKKFAQFKAIVEGGLLGRIDVGMDKIRLDNNLLDQTFPFTPFFQIGRKAYMKEEMIVIQPRKALLFDGIEYFNEQKIKKVRRAFRGLLLVLHENGLFGVEISVEKNNNAPFSLDELIEGVIEFDKFFAEIYVKNQHHSVICWLLLFRAIPTIDWAKFVRKKWPDFKTTIHAFTFVSANAGFFKAIFKKISSINEAGKPLEIRAISEYMRLSTFWHMLPEIGDTRVKKYLITMEKTTKSCIDYYINKFFPHCLEHIMAQDFLEGPLNGMKYKEAVRLTKDIFEKVQRGFLKYLQNSNWMGNVLKRETMWKIKSIRVQIGYSPEILDGVGLERKYYANLLLSPDMAWPEMLARVQRQSAAWPSAVIPAVGSELLARYDEYTNSVAVNGLALGRPYLLLVNHHSDNSQVAAATSQAYNFGAMGSVIGHEMAHALDPISIKKAANGRVQRILMVDHYARRPIVGKLIQQKYNQKMDYLRKQYATYWIESDRKDAEFTLREDFSDNLGLQVAYEAYRMDGKDVDDPHEILAMDRFNKKQLFFIAFANKECVEFTEEGRIQSKTRDPHSFPSARVNLPLVNLPAFADAFQCPAGSKMNPIN